MRPLRVLVVLPMYGGSLPIGRYCVAALRKLGQSVRVFDANELFAGYMGIRKLDISPSRQTSLTNGFLRLVSQAIWLQIQEVKPDLVLALAQAPIDRNLLLKMRDESIRTVMWFVEDYKLFTYWQLLAPLYDAFAVIQKEPFLEKLKEVGQTHAFYLPLAALPDFHRQVTLTPQESQEYGADISFLGAGYPNRRLAFLGLADRDFKIWGSDWEDEKYLAKNIQRNGARVNEEDSIKIYNGAKINLNLHSSIDTKSLVGGGDFVNPRTFELASIGAFQLTDKRSLMSELFDKEELATFSTIEEMYDQIDYYLTHPEERKSYTEKARERVLKDHTYEIRMKQLLAYMESEFGAWKDREAEESDALDIDRAIAQKIDELAVKLGLAKNSDFSDVVATLRRQSGPLDELETALLFLDEWRKQYCK